MSKKKGKKEHADMSFLDHLEELRWHLVRSVLAIVVIAIVAFIYKNIVFDFIIIAPKEPGFFTNRILCQFGQFVGVERLCINSQPLSLININMAGQFTAHIMVSLIGGFIVAFPYIFWEMWRFMAPALYDNEKKYASGSVFFSSLLFMLGVLFGYFLIVPLSVHFLGTYQVSAEVANQINLVSYMKTVASITLASGVIFELPILVFFLTKVGLVTPEFLKRYRRHSLVIILLLSAIITPPDVFSQILVSLPLLILYEVGIKISKAIVKIEREEQEAWARENTGTEQKSSTGEKPEEKKSAKNQDENENENETKKRDDTLGYGYDPYEDND